jgi:hypothetical protein
VKGNTTSNCRVFPGAGQIRRCPDQRPAKTSVLSAPRFSAKVVLSPATERLVVEAKIRRASERGPEGPGVVSGRQANWVRKDGPDRIVCIHNVGGLLCFVHLFRGPTKPSKATCNPVTLRERRDSAPPFPEEAYSPLLKPRCGPPAATGAD